MEETETKSFFQTLRSGLIRSIEELNLFSDHPVWSSTLDHREQRLSTRWFIFLLVLSIIIVLGYTSFAARTQEISLDQFTLDQFEQLSLQYSSTVHAPCTEVSIGYDRFLTISPQFHELCSSSFVKQKWISSLFLPNATSYHLLDVRTFSFAQFRALGLLCRVAKRIVRDTRRTFSTTHFVTNRLLPRDQFNEIAQVLVDNLKLNIVGDQKQISDLVSLMIAQNRILSGLRTNYFVVSIPGSRSYTTINAVYEKGPNSNETNFCDCRLQSHQCVSPAGIFHNWTLPEFGQALRFDPLAALQISGLMAGCTPLDSIRKSTLECLYNRSCIDQLSFKANKTEFLPLNQSSTRFSIKKTIGELFDRWLFIESWFDSWSFENYYQACRPKSLSYRYERRFHWSWIIATTLSTFGGLVIAWQLIVPIFVRLHQRRKRNNNDHCIIQRAPLRTVLFKHAHRTIFTFNLFRSSENNDLEEERLGIIATRFYIVILCLSICIFGVYTSLLKRTQTIVVDYPSMSQFEQLHQLHSSTLLCPCSRFSMSYSRIMSATANYHEICSSSFLDDYWLSYFGRVELDFDQVEFLSLDFRIIGQTFFDLMKIFCQTSNKTVSNALRVFRSTRLVTLNVLSREQFNIETNIRIKKFQQQTIASFLDLIELIRSAIQTNHLLTEVWTSAGPFSTFDNQTMKWSLRFRPRSFYTNSCSCAVSNRCTRPLGFYLQTDSVYSDPNITIPGLVISCYPIDSYLLSTLECLYDRECLDLIIKSYDFDVTGLVRPLDTRAVNIEPLNRTRTRFAVDTNMESIVSQLFVEYWTNFSNYSAYYHRCAPMKCTFTIQQRFDTGYILAMLIGFYGGLSALLEIILPHIVKLIANRRRIRCASFSIRQYIRSLNLFSTEETRAEENIATRIYLVILFLAVIVAILYAGPFSTETKTIVIASPSISTINMLHKKNISTLSCPCSRVAINYSIFQSISPTFHPLCTSQFVDPIYWSVAFDSQNNFSSEFISQYQILASLCERANRFLANAQNVFASRELISEETLTMESFDNQSEALRSNFIESISSNFRRIYSFIIESFSVNQLMNRFASNWQVSFTDEKEKYMIATSPRLFSSSNCTCATSRNCFESLTSNLNSACQPFDSFRLSKFENYSISQLINDLFVIEWNNRSDYKAYFQACRPLECQYTVADRNNFIYIFTTVLGLYGGLTCALRLIFGRILWFYRFWIRHGRPQPSSV